MANTPVELRAPTGLSLTLELYPYGSDALANPGGDSLIEQTNRKGLYQATVSEPLVGWHTAHVNMGTTLLAVYDVYLEDDTDVHRCEDAPQRLHDGHDGGKVQAGSEANQLNLASGRVLLQATQTGVTIPAVDQVAGSVTLDTSEDIYPADIQLTVDNTNSRDEYTVCWFRNGTVVADGITAATIEVARRSDGTRLIAANTALVAISNTGAFKHDEPTHRIAAGEAVIVTTQAVIDGATRSWRRLLSRDSLS